MLSVEAIRPEKDRPGIPSALLAFNAIVNGKPELHLNGVYFLRYELNGKRV
jgi:hypothetical protein